MRVEAWDLSCVLFENCVRKSALDIELADILRLWSSSMWISGYCRGLANRKVPWERKNRVPFEWRNCAEDYVCWNFFLWFYGLQHWILCLVNIGCLLIFDLYSLLLRESLLQHVSQFFLVLLNSFMDLYQYSLCNQVSCLFLVIKRLQKIVTLLESGLPFLLETFCVLFNPVVLTVVFDMP